MPKPATESEGWFGAFLHFGVTAIVGAFVGHWIGKRRGFRTPVVEWRWAHRETLGP